MVWVILAIKPPNRKRYSLNDSLCIDRGLNAFDWMIVLSKASSLTVFPIETTDEQNHALVLALNEIYKGNGLLSYTINLDFTAIPYFGVKSPL